MLVLLLTYLKFTASAPGAHLFLGRFYQALPDLCPNLERAFSAPSRLGAAAMEDTVFSRPLHRTSSTRADPLWTEATGKLDTESARWAIVFLES